MTMYPALVCPACGSFRVHTCGIRSIQTSKTKPTKMPRLACDECYLVYDRDGKLEPQPYNKDFVDTVLFKKGDDECDTQI